MTKVINIDEIKVIDTSNPLDEQEFIKEQYDIETYPFLSLKIDTFEQLEYLFREIRRDEERKSDKRFKFIYRGQKDFNWILQSSLERDAKLYGVCFDTLESISARNFKELAREKLSDQSILRNPNHEELENEIWAAGQHMGLKSPLLDWSKVFYIALFFAFEKELEEIKYRAVYRIDTLSLANHTGHGHVGFIFNPYSDPIGRITAQQGIFTTYGMVGILNKEEESIEKRNISLSEKYKDKIRNAIKLYISNDLRKEIISYLSHLGIRFETIYPDLQGAVLEANYRLEQSIKNIKKHQEEQNQKKQPANREGIITT
jgi:hypothetical protein